jgi:hypothetical protein
MSAETKGLRETVSIIRYGDVIQILGESFAPLDVKPDNSIYAELDKALAARKNQGAKGATQAHHPP